jgi:hypothetical protein
MRPRQSALQILGVRGYTGAADLAAMQRGEGGMASFDDRKKGFERKFEHDQELRFKVTARRNRLLGHWAAQEMGLPASEHDDYAKSVVMADFEKPGDSDVIEKVMADFSAKGIAMSEHRIRKHMDELMAVAREQVMKEVG